MRARNAGARRAAGGALVLVFAAALVGPAAAGRGDRTPPTAPTNLRVTALGQKSVTLAWDPSTDKSSFSYNVVKDGQSFTVPSTRTSYTIDWLSPGRTYSFYVTATDSSLNQSAPSNTVTVTTLSDTTPPGAPTLSGSVLSPSKVSLSWNRTADDLSWIVGWRIFANGVQVTQHINWTGETSVFLRHLAPGTTYTFRVDAHDSSGNAAPSNEVTLTTPASNDVTPPSAPTNVHLVEEVGGCEVWIGWTQSTDDTDPQSMIEYEIYVNGVLSPLAVSGGIDRDFVYANSGDNTFVVKAVDQSGNTSAPSEPFTTTLWC